MLQASSLGTQRTQTDLVVAVTSDCKDLRVTWEIPALRVCWWKCAVSSCSCLLEIVCLLCKPLDIIKSWRLCTMIVTVLDHGYCALGVCEMLVTCCIVMSGQALTLPFAVVQARGLTSYGLSESANVMSDTEYEQFKSTWQPQPLRPQQSMAAAPTVAAAGSQVKPVACHRSASSARLQHLHRAHALPVRRPANSLFKRTCVGMPILHCLSALGSRVVSAQQACRL